MFESFRRVADGVQGLQGTLEDIRLVLTAQAENALQATELTARVAEIEIGYAKWTAEAEAAMLKADALFKNARNSEERARDARKKANGAAEGRVEGEIEMRAAYAELFGTGLPEGDVEGVQPTTMQRVRDRVEVGTRVETSKNLRLRAKFG